MEFEYDVVAHIDDSVKITDLYTTFGEFKKTNRYRSGLASVLRDVRGGQHLRFIGSIYKTPEVCIKAVENSPEFDVFPVPEKIRDFVLKEVINKGVGGGTVFQKNLKQKS